MKKFVFIRQNDETLSQKYDSSQKRKNQNKKCQTTATSIRYGHEKKERWRVKNKIKTQISRPRVMCIGSVYVIKTVSWPRRKKSHLIQGRPWLSHDQEEKRVISSKGDPGCLVTKKKRRAISSKGDYFRPWIFWGGRRERKNNTPPPSEDVVHAAMQRRSDRGEGTRQDRKRRKKLGEITGTRPKMRRLVGCVFVSGGGWKNTGAK